MWRTRLRSFIEIGAWERCLKSGQLKSRKKEEKKKKKMWRRSPLVHGDGFMMETDSYTFLGIILDKKIKFQKPLSYA